MAILDQIRNAEDIQSLNTNELEQLAVELRHEISRTVSLTGGHLASNLGTVELTLALLRCFDFREDKVVWDVGHQSYTYKILTGRRKAFSNLRQKEGLSGFPKRQESPYDAFNTGHSSTAVSAALGIGRALKKTGKPGRAIAVVGDGAMTGGMFYEALNNIDESLDDILLIINDNQMSISNNVGAISRHLNNLRVSRRYNMAKQQWSRFLLKVPLLGTSLLWLMNRVKSRLRRSLFKESDFAYFEALGLRYYGPVDGHNIDALTRHMRTLKFRSGPAVLHVCTQKGKGYEKAEQAPVLYHGVSPFSLDKGVMEVPINQGQNNFTQAFSQLLLDAAERDKCIVAITAAMSQGTGLEAFAHCFPDRFYDVGIAEAHAVTMAAGMATAGLKPVLCIYATFLQRALDQVLHDAALQNLPVLFAVDRSGIVGNDGETHQGIYDQAFLVAVPGLKIFYPSTYAALKRCFNWAIQYKDGPVVLRYPRGSEHALAAEAYEALVLSEETTELPQSLCLRSGKDLTIAVLGQLLGQTLELASSLAQEGIDLEVVDVCALKPLDCKGIVASALKTGALISLEEQILAGGLGEQLAFYLQENAICLPFAGLHIGDYPVEQASPQESLKDCALDAKAMTRKIRSLLNNKLKHASGSKENAGRVFKNEKEGD